MVKCTKIHKTATYVCRGNKNFSKRMSTNFANNSFELKDILDAVQTTIRKMNPDYDIAIKRLHLYI